MISCLILLLHRLSYLIYYPTLSYILSYLIIYCDILSYLVVSYIVLSYLVIIIEEEGGASGRKEEGGAVGGVRVITRTPILRIWGKREEASSWRVVLAGGGANSKEGIQRKTGGSLSGGSAGLSGRRFSAARRSTALSKKGRMSRAGALFLLGAAPMRERVARQSKLKREEISSGSAGFVGTAAFGGQLEHRP